MKNIYIKFCPFIVLLFFTNAGCQKINDNKVLFEITPESSSSTIINEVGGIEFKFCVLSDSGQPKTIFKQNENFILSFSIKNNLNDAISITTEFINNNFFRIFQTLNKTDFGIPWTGLWCEYSLSPKIIEVGNSSQIVLSCPWILTSEHQPVYPLCKSQNQDYLPVGEYFTFIDLNFYFNVSGKNKVINNIIYKINFRVE